MIEDLSFSPESEVIVYANLCKQFLFKVGEEFCKATSEYYRNMSF